MTSNTVHSTERSSFGRRVRLEDAMPSTSYAEGWCLTLARLARTGVDIVTPAPTLHALCNFRSDYALHRPCSDHHKLGVQQHLWRRLHRAALGTAEDVLASIW